MLARGSQISARCASAHFLMHSSCPSRLDRTVYSRVEVATARPVFVHANDQAGCTADAEQQCDRPSERNQGSTTQRASENPPPSFGPSSSYDADDREPNTVASRQERFARPLVMPPRHQPGVRSDVAGASITDLTESSEIYNVEMSWLAFNWRVLSMALLPHVPLIERLNFLSIASSNLDGFFAKRVGGLMKQQAAGLSMLKKPVPKTPQQQLTVIAQEVKLMMSWQCWALNALVMPQLAQHGIHLLKLADLSPEGLAHLHDYYIREVDKLLTPIKLDPAHPFPCLPSGSLNIAVVLQDPNNLERTLCAIINIPPLLSRWQRVPANFSHPDSVKAWQHGFIPLEMVIIENLAHLFGGMTIESAHTFRVTRNAELDRHEEDADDLLDMISDELRERRFAPFVRLEVDSKMPDDLVEFLAGELQIELEQDVYRCSGPLDQGDLTQVTKLLDPPLLEQLSWRPWNPTVHPRLANPYRRRSYKRLSQWSGSRWKGVRSIFNIIRDGDILLHHPYQSFATSTLRFVEEAARDPAVVAIKATLYRTSSDSPVIAALLKAADNGKQVAVLVELKARFDEARNVDFAQRLEDAGCNVAYGLVGLKTHAKCVLVVRREKAAEHGLRTYVHIGTGNYNPSTANLYTDIGLLTCDAEIGEDVVDLFKFLTGLHMQSAVGGYRKLLVANEYMKTEFLALIDREIANADAGLPAALCVKVNGLDDKAMCAKLYEASQRGVRVDCIVRGVCRLRPGIPGVSDNMRVVSHIGRFLEHHRVYMFLNAGNPLYYVGSADWMKRNLQQRVELAAPITRSNSRDRLRELLGLSLSDTGAWEMLTDGTYRRPATRVDEACLSAPMLGQAPFPAPMLERLPSEGLQGALMKNMLVKIKAFQENGVTF